MRSFIATAAVVAALTGYPAFAEEAASQPPTRIEVDQQAKAFVFIIDGEPVAMLDKAGLYVPGEISYGKWITDTGPDFVREKIAARAMKEATDD